MGFLLWEASFLEVGCCRNWPGSLEPGIPIVTLADAVTQHILVPFPGVHGQGNLQVTLTGSFVHADLVST